MAQGVRDAFEMEPPRARRGSTVFVSPLAFGQPARDFASGGDISRRESSGAVAAILPGGRLHLQHGPIDIVAEAFGALTAVQAGYVRAAGRFASVLEELVAELSALRSEHGLVKGRIARRMAAAVAPFRPTFITPMAAVAGAVAEEVLVALVGPGITRAYANNGGDIALWLGEGESLTCALAASEGADRVTVHEADPMRGIATSGWRGRSFSLGIADAVTVLARTAAMADAAATMIANAVVVDHPGILRRPAQELQPDNDLGARPVTVAVPLLSAGERLLALNAGLAVAEDFRARGLIEGAALFLQGEARMTGSIALQGGWASD